MVFIEKEGIPSSVDESIIKIKKSKKWKDIKEDDTNAIRAVFNDEFPKDEIKRILVHEQHGLCAYCMKRIKNDNHSRIEHLKPLSKNKADAINYENMLGVCEGGEKAGGEKGRILCCDAHKSESEISLSPLNEIQMEKIAYKPDGKIYTEPYDKDMEDDINNILVLNGIMKADGTVRDTATEVLKGRRDAYERAQRMMDELNRKGKCTSANLQKIINSLMEKEEREEFVGVKLFYFKKKLNALVKQGY